MDGSNDYEDDNYLRPIQPIERAPPALAHEVSDRETVIADGQISSVIFLTLLTFLPCLCCICMLLCCCQDPECRGRFNKLLARLIRKLKGLKKLAQDDISEDEDEDEEDDEEKVERRRRRRHKPRSRSRGKAKYANDCSPLIRLPVCPEVPYTITVTTDCEEEYNCGDGRYLPEKDDCCDPPYISDRYGRQDPCEPFEDRFPPPAKVSEKPTPPAALPASTQTEEDLPKPSENDLKNDQRKRSLSDFDPEVYDRHILVFYGMPEDTDPNFFERNFPGKIIESSADEKGGRNFKLEFQSFEDARAPYRKALKLDYRGQPLDVEPIEWPPFVPNPEEEKKVSGSDLHTLSEIPEEPTPTETEISEPEEQEPPKPPRNTRSLSDFDSAVYNREILEFHGLPPTVDVAYLEQLFPDGKIIMAEGAKGGWDAEVRFKNFEDARKAFRIADDHTTVEAISNVMPRLRQPDDTSDVETTYTNPQALKPSSRWKKARVPYIAQFFKTRKKDRSEELPEPEYTQLIEPEPEPEPDPPLPSPPPSTTPSAPVTASSVTTYEPESEPEPIASKPSGKVNRPASASPSATKSKTKPKGEPYFAPDGHAVYFKTKPKTTLTLAKNWSPLEYDHTILDVHNIPLGTQKLQIEKWFPKATVKSFERDPEDSGKVIAILQFKTEREAEKAFHENHGQTMNGKDLNISPVKLDPEKKAEALKKEQEKFKELKDKQSKAKQAQSKSKNTLRK